MDEFCNQWITIESMVPIQKWMQWLGSSTDEWHDYTRKERTKETITKQWIFKVPEKPREDVNEPSAGQQLLVNK